MASLSPLLKEIMAKHGLTELATPEKYKSLSEEEKNKLFELQKSVIDEFRLRSTEEINKLQEEYMSLQSKPPAAKPMAKTLPEPVKLTAINQKRAMNQSRIELKQTKTIKPLSKSTSFDADTLNRRNPRAIKEVPQEPQQPAKVRYDNLDQRPRFKF
ncbi:hypothetical protein TVAG_325980 [Trichomonas vaginalis G3]|uniref:Uncharacterized protein n=1 Tax=Trichomonas vaginalis (strain ATCC PRA-98 / G3) TaxID=412133 RepID=A2G8Q5_TRIV3|nr:hypothetical protein TVAGG3_0741240 [Trichomonas vaginalis G3]EAX86463.1 hypothetical protein TVAG_325980 [Trichomonas vaginalis G3]KAI5511897.1 hypothetical protein TVAGG3_0741240 [Trichomonas vaginalis G3]|eukprot:XP_001299393.1 hypothetical protein [Trichomonas vaginalis G3]